ncbi:MAG TPA: ChbG/HpnK family deacetylase [Candidatus Angelobacter sp.]|nr:ChbG/HpnK family deacetylase [Candidatus Angelobacter sp.]
MRRLIVNADDFGLTSGVNRAIVEGSVSGIITSATLMAAAPAFDDAVALARNHSQLRTGCHVVLIDGAPLADEVPTLTIANRRFRSSLKDFALAALRGRLSPGDIQREAEAQIRKIQSSGLTVTHVDSHKHTHMFPQVLRPVLRAARACGVRAVRNPFEPLSAWPGGLMTRAPGMWLRCAGVGAFRVFRRAFYRAIRDQGMRTTYGTVAIAATGKLDQKMLLAILASLPEGTWEMVCHPGYADADLKAAGTRLFGSRAVELQALTSEETRNALRRRDIQLISYADLEDS